MSPAAVGRRSTPLQYRIRSEFLRRAAPHGGIGRRLAVSVAIVPATVNTVLTHRWRRKIVPPTSVAALRDSRCLTSRYMVG